MNTMSNRTELPPSLTGLTHLVEAATALTKLDSPACLTAKQQQQQQQFTNIAPQQSSTKSPLLPKGFIVSDDDLSDSNKVPTSSSNNSFNLRSSREIFPQRLMAILSDPTLTDVVSWLPHGSSFVIIRPDVFAERVLPKYLPSDRSSTKYPSFTRKLNRWGFRQATRGPDTGAFHHPLFKRDDPHLCLDMVCQKSRKRSSTQKKSTKSSNDKKSQSSKPSAANISNDEVSTSSEPSSTSLPPKKRKMASLTSSVEKPEAVAPQRVQTVSPSSSCASIEGQDTAFSLETQTAPTLVMKNYAPTTTDTPTTWFPVPNDPKLIAETLKAHEEKERLCIAKSMLYEAYINALKSN